MKPPKKLLSEDERTSVNRAIAKAENKTAAEILPALASASGRYDRAEDVVGLWCALGLLSAVWIVFQGPAVDSGSWTEETVLRLELLPLLGVLVAGFLAGAVVAGRTPWLRRLFVPRREMEAETAARAKTLFFDRRLHRTRDAAGVLLYVSLFERSAAVLVDDAVAEKLGERSLNEVCDQVVAGLRASGPVEGLMRGLDRLGDLLSVALPADKERENAVSNEVIVID
jgi:putative membrane protein